MVEDFPDQAAPVIDQVLTQAEQRIEALQVQAATANSQTRKALDEQIDAQTRAATVLSGYLLDWAKTQDFDAQTMMPFEVIRGKTLRMSGQIDQAYAILSPLVNEFPNDAQVMIEYAQVLYARGDEDSLVEAVRYYDRLITGLGAPYPKEWWTAWVRRLQVNDLLNEGTEEIPLRVRQLRMTDPDLGGPVTKLELERLEHKYSR
jgi:predicted Zn-dependent protease